MGIWISMGISILISGILLKSFKIWQRILIVAVLLVPTFFMSFQVASVLIRILDNFISFEMKLAGLIFAIGYMWASICFDIPVLSYFINRYKSKKIGLPKLIVYSFIAKSVITFLYCFVILLQNK